ncbi:MAG: glutamine synthetase family protein [Alkalispirochaetaceae bacterium]
MIDLKNAIGTSVGESEPGAGSREELKAFLIDQKVEMIRLEYVDLLGVTRAKLLPVEMLDQIMEDGIAFCAAIMAIGYDNSVAEVKGLSEYNYNDMKIVADPTTLVPVPYLSNTVACTGDLYYQGRPMLQSPRWFLKSMIEKYRQLGLEPISASELEFFLYKRGADGDWQPYTSHTGNCYTGNVRIDPSGYLSLLTQALKQMNYNVLYMNHEFFPGQYEYNWMHGEALRVADETAGFKEVCKDIAAQHGMMATFMGRPTTDSGGSGCHFHISLNDESGRNRFHDRGADREMSRLMRNFVGGLIAHARALTAFLAPTVNCYKRYRPDSFAPYYIGWGYDNRTTYIRIPEERGAATRVEVRAGSAAANPYLALAGILAAGLDGIHHGIEPPEIVTSDLYHDQTRQEAIVPRSLFRALRELESDEWIREMAGKELINNFIAVKDMEVESYINHVSDWEWNTYSYHV